MLRQCVRHRRRHAANAQLDDGAVWHQARDVAADDELPRVWRFVRNFGQRQVALACDHHAAAMQAKGRAGAWHVRVDFDQHNARRLRGVPHIVHRATEAVVTLCVSGRHLQQHDIGLEHARVEVRRQLRQLRWNHTRRAAPNNVTDRPQAAIGGDAKGRVDWGAPSRVERKAAKHVYLPEPGRQRKQFVHQAHRLSSRLSHHHVVATAQVFSEDGAFHRHAFRS